MLMTLRTFVESAFVVCFVSHCARKVWGLSISMLLENGAEEKGQAAYMANACAMSCQHDTNALQKQASLDVQEVYSASSR